MAHRNPLLKALVITRKILWHVQIVGIGMAYMEVLIESDKHDEMIEYMDQKVKGTKKDLHDKIFDLRLTDLKSQFIVIKTIFEKVIYGTDDVSLRRSRLDSAFVICEEIFLMISEPHSELYKSAQYCIDLVSCFVIVHLGMLQMAVQCYNLLDYEDRLNFCLEFYPILIKSYVEQAINNYVKPIILNYHNQYNSLKQVEEIYYELTDSVVYKLSRNNHLCWKTTMEDMAKDRMYYNFEEESFIEIEPAFMLGPEPPILCRALRHGVTLKLEDLYSRYLTGIDQVVHKLRFTQTEMNDNDLPDCDEEVKEFEKENYDFSPLKPVVGKSSKLKLKRCQTMKLTEASPIKKLDTSEDIK
jgi:hypothetical protein